MSCLRMALLCTRNILPTPDLVTVLSISLFAEVLCFTGILLPGLRFLRAP